MTVQQSTPADRIFFDKPKVLLIDMPPEVVRKLGQSPFNVNVGTFGSPHIAIEESADFGESCFPIVQSHKLPNHREAEVVFINLAVTSNPVYPSPTIPSRFVAASYGQQIDPRPCSMSEIRDDFDRILKHGGVFVVFAEPRIPMQAVRIGSPMGERLNFDNWGFLSILSSSYLKFTAHGGNEISVDTGIKTGAGLGELLKRYVRDMVFRTNIEATTFGKSTFFPLLKNKFNETVGCIIGSNDTKGRVLIFPHVANVDLFVDELLSTCLPHMVPSLFPYGSGSHWLERQEYQLPEVSRLKNEIVDVQTKADLRAKALEEEIKELNTKWSFLHTILTAQHDELVIAVMQTLEFIGFKSVENMDENEETKKGNKQEDLQIRDREPILIAEVKGVLGSPDEDEVNQVNKYVLRRQREDRSKTYRGLVIINHECKKPPLLRNNKNCFTDIQINDATDTDVTLFSTWDFYRLISGMRAWGWDARHIRELLYRPGRVGNVPAHYEFIGTVKRFLPDLSVIGVEPEVADLSVGDKLGVVFADRFLEFDIDELGVDKQKITIAQKGVMVGIKSPERIPEKMEVYRVMGSR